MRRFSKHLALLALAVVVFAAAFPASSAIGAAALSVTVPTSPIAESPDFATRVLGDPWDMSQYSDVSQYLNESGQRRLLGSPQVQNGIFSGVSLNDAVTGDGNAYFFPLFPGYTGAGAQDPIVTLGKIGYRYPINAGAYHCLYVAVKTDSPAATGLGTDALRVLWFADGRLNAPGGQYGVTYSFLYPETTQKPIARWQVLKLDLATSPVIAGAGWNARATWQGLRIDPTTNAANTPFQVDWVRLTTCGASNHSIRWTPNGSITHVWLRPNGTTRDIRLPGPVNGNSGSAQIDVQGVAPGQYLVGLGTATSCCTQRSSQLLTINQTPLATFAQPSFTSGADYAAKAGNPWDFNDAVDGKVGYYAGNTPPTTSYDNGVLTTVTPPGPLPAGIDIYINLNTPAPVSTSLYRYLTIRMYTGGPWQNVPEATIGRWIWSVPGISGRSGYLCTMVGPDIPLDVGWQTYTIDLHDPASNGGLAEDRQGECPAGALNWQSLTPAIALRFDPNENVTGAINPKTPGTSLLQQIDWIKLTADNVVGSGTPYAIKLGLNKPAGQIVSRTFYYTTSRQQPTQHRAKQQAVAPPAGANRVYAPIAARPGPEADTVTNPLDFVWDTSGVAPGTYYICAALNDGTNSNTVCSDAPVIVQ